MTNSNSPTNQTDLLDLLQSNKGTVSSALGKELAKKVLNGEITILEQAVQYTIYDLETVQSKSIRAGAAKVVELVAEKQPKLVAPHLQTMLPALTVLEPQTKWMIIRTMGFCARENTEVAAMAIKFADEYISAKKAGQLCLVSSADLFLGDYGALSSEHAKEVFPILEKSMANAIKNEPDWILEALIKMFANLDADSKEIALSFARINADSERKATQKRVMKLMSQTLA